MTTKRRNWADKPVKRDWTPVLRDGVYCSPACGGGKGVCDKSKYDLAVKKSNELAKKMGDGWKPYVWENLGWFYKVTKGKLEVYGQRGDYSIFLQTTPQFVLHHKNPMTGAKLALKGLDNLITTLQKDRKAATLCILLAFGFLLSGCGAGGNPPISAVAPPPPPASTTSTPVTAPTGTTTTTTAQQVFTVFGNSQTQGYELPECGTSITCHPPDAWPAVMATAKGWTIDNQAVGGTTCGDLTTTGFTESLWDLKIDSTSVTAYAHFHNEEANFGFEAQGALYARNCIEAQTAWLAIPESQKIRAINCTQNGFWAASQNSSAAQTITPGASLSCAVTGSVVYLSTARVNQSNIGTYTVSVDGNLITDQETQSTLFSQSNNVSPSALTNFIRVAGLANGPHTVVVTCINPGSSGCLVFYAAGLSGAPTVPAVFSVAPFPNAPTNTSDYFDSATYMQYRDEWISLVAELKSDGLNIIPVDVGNSQIYNPITQSQPDGVHETVAGHAAIGNYAATLQF